MPWSASPEHAGGSRVQVVIRLLFGIGVVLLPLQAWSQPKGMYPSQEAVAEKGEELGCEGMHMNEGKWMPYLDEQSLHRALRK